MASQADGDHSRIINHALVPPVGVYELDPVHTFVGFGGSLTDPKGNIRVAFRAHGTIARRDFGLSHDILKEAGTLLVGKDITNDIDAEAIRPR